MGKLQQSDNYCGEDVGLFQTRPEKVKEIWNLQWIYLRFENWERTWAIFD